MVKAFSELGVQAFCERSRSGDGVHVWVFFSEPVPAKYARDLGALALSHAMQASGEIDFSCYDRFFPNQDAIPEGGFGNLIALPLQGGPRSAGNSVFIDECGVAYDDQWAVLQHAVEKRLSSKQLSGLLARHEKHEILGTLSLDEEEPGGSSGDKPWRKSTKGSLGAGDLPAVLKVVRANKLYITLDQLSQKASDRIARLAAFSNPEFYKAQAMRRSVHDKPRIISCAGKEDGYLTLPRGCEEALAKLVRDAGSELSVEDETEAGKPIKVTFKGTLYDDQAAAAEAMLRENNGILWAATAFGKTVTSIYMIAQAGVSAAILVDRVSLALQWQEKLHALLEIDEPLPQAENTRGRKKKYTPVGLLSGSKNTLTGNVDVFTYQSLAAKEDPGELLEGYGMVIVDECHHSSALTYERVISSTRARRIYGASATPQRADGHHPIAFMLCGPVRFKRTAKEQAALHGFDHVVLPRFTGFHRPLTYESGGWTPTKAYECIALDDARNRLIAEDALAAWKKGRSPLVLTKRVDHAKTLLALIEESCPNVYLLTGEGSAKAKRERLADAHTAASNGPLIIVATSSYAGEGFDMPRLDTLCLASPASHETVLNQYTGRLHRRFDGKEKAVVYDYVDFNDPMLESMYHKRLKAYASLGYRVCSCADGAHAEDSGGGIYLGTAFKEDLLADIASAERELVICSPQLHKSRFHQVTKACLAAQRRGVRVLVVTQPLESYGPSKQVEAAKLLGILAESELGHVEIAHPLHRFMTVDGHIAWYGGASILGYWDADDGLLRAEDAAMASMLQDSVRQLMG